MASVNFVLRIDKIGKRDGKAPLFVRLSHHRKSRYTSLGIKIDPAHWLADQQRVSRAHPHSHRLNSQLGHKRAEFEELALDLEQNQPPMGKMNLKQLLAGTSAQCFLDYAFEHAKRLADQGRHSTAKAYRATYRQFGEWLEEAKGKDHLPLGEFSLRIAQDFKAYLERQLGNHPNTVQVKFAALRRAMNLAKREGLITDAQNTLRNILTPGRKTQKVIPSRDDMQRIEAVDLEGDSQMWDVRNLYLFASRMAGIRFGDVLSLRWHMLDGDHLQWQTRKSRKQLRLFVPQNVREIIAHYSRPDCLPSGFIFPFLRGDEELSDAALSRRIGSWNSRCNKALKAISKKAGLARAYSFHTSRHFFATESLRRGVRVEVLKELLTHSSIEQTMAYVRISNEEMDAAMGM